MDGAETWREITHIVLPLAWGDWRLLHFCVSFLLE